MQMQQTLGMLHSATSNRTTGDGNVIQGYIQDTCSDLHNFMNKIAYPQMLLMLLN
jgi:hypothetical protein